VLGVSMVLNLVIAGFFGTLIPLLLDRIDKDPATSATIFITTMTDVLGFLVFLGLARAVLT
jgi:magnesium transporter